ncbi:MAG: hypothetical protein WC107_07525 [Patescibacteria group bacterium]
MRDNFWLKQKLDSVWNSYFPEVNRLNNIEVFFGKRAKRRLASIRQKAHNDKKSDTQIRVTGFYKDERVPEFVVETTLAHEICHYVHGFASPLPQFSRFPHRGDMVDKELEKRGVGDQLKEQKAWLEKNWNNIVGDAIFIPGTVRRKRKKAPAYISVLRTFGII